MSRVRPAEISRRLRDGLGGLLFALAFTLVLVLTLAPRGFFISPGFAAAEQDALGQPSADSWAAADTRKGVER